MTSPPDGGSEPVDLFTFIPDDGPDITVSAAGDGLVVCRDDDGRTAGPVDEAGLGDALAGLRDAAGVDAAARWTGWWWTDEWSTGMLAGRVGRWVEGSVGEFSVDGVVWEAYDPPWPRNVFDGERVLAEESWEVEAQYPGQDSAGTFYLLDLGDRFPVFHFCGGMQYEGDMDASTVDDAIVFFRSRYAWEPGQER